MRRITRRSLLLGFLALGPAAALGCRSDRDFRILGYSTKLPFRDDIRTVYVPVFKNAATPQAFQTTPTRELEVDITRAVIREIEARTPMKVVSNRDEADTELLGTVTFIGRGTLNINQQALVREGEMTVKCSVVWTDLRTGEVLSNGRPPRVDAPPAPFDPTIPPVEITPPKVRTYPVEVVGTGRVLIELGQTTTTGLQEATNSIARQVAQLMEAPW